MYIHIKYILIKLVYNLVVLHPPEEREAGVELYARARQNLPR